MSKKSHNLKRRKGTRGSSSYAPFISFGMKSTSCLAIFLVIYAISVFCFVPALKDDEKAQKIKNAKDKIIKKKKALMGHVKKEGQAWKKEINHVRRRGRDAIEKQLMEKALEQFNQNNRLFPKKNTGKFQPPKEEDQILAEEEELAEANRRRHLDKGIHVMKKRPSHVEKKKPERAAKHEKHGASINHHHHDGEDNKGNNEKPTTGFVVLGMHRSGTSMLAGLLVEGYGYKTGGPLIQPAYDNEKGFFELIPAVLQSDEFMYEQNINWSANVGNYDAERALKAYTTRKIKIEKGVKALKVLNDPNNIPWLQKDPRMCITLRTWLPLLNSKPAAIFTYRHPLEVAMSLTKRNEGFNILRGLRLWIHYNKAAVQNSFDLCTVRSNNNAVLADPLGEVRRVVNGLTRCGVPSPPTKITEEIINGFVDPNLQHNKKKLEKKNKNRKILKTFNDGDCEVKDYDSKALGTKRKEEKDMYLTAMKVYCDFESGAAYEEDYVWPDV